MKLLSFVFDGTGYVSSVVLGSYGMLVRLGPTNFCTSRINRDLMVKKDVITGSALGGEPKLIISFSVPGV